MTMDSEALREYLDWYKANFANIFAKHEDYKWESVQIFQSSYHPDKANYPEILKTCFRRSENLLNSKSVFSLGMMLDITRFSLEHPDTKTSGIDLFYDLFEGISPDDAEEVLLSKISSFRKQIREYVKAFMPDKINDYQDLHAVSVYLNHRYPDRFYMYRTSEFTEFNELIDKEYPFKWGADSNYISYLKMCNGINAILRRELEFDEGFRLSVQKAISSSNKYYPDPEYRILTQDFIYSVTTYYGQDFTGRYKEQMKSKNLTPEISFVDVEELSVSDHTTTTITDSKTPSKIDYVKRQKENSRLGKIGEQWVYKCEMKRLTAAGRDDLAKKVIWHAKDDDTKGYDILSYDEDGNEIFIEVKTTNGEMNTPFYISAREKAVSNKYPEKYRLYRVYNFETEAKIRVIKGDIGLLKPKPTNYIVYIDTSSKKDVQDITQM